MVKLNLKSEFKNVQENEKSCKKTIDWKRDNELEEILFINYLNHKSLKIDKFDWKWKIPFFHFLSHSSIPLDYVQ